MTRNRLPDRRAADVIAFEHDGRRWTASFGRFDDGRLAEAFLDGPKESPLAEAARESALLASLALQHSCSLATIRHALNGRDAGPLATALDLVANSEASS